MVSVLGISLEPLHRRLPGHVARWSQESRHKGKLALVCLECTRFLGLREVLAQASTRGLLPRSSSEAMMRGATAPQKSQHRRNHSTAEITAPQKLQHRRNHSTAEITAPQKLQHRRDHSTAEITATQESIKHAKDSVGTISVFWLF